MYHELQVAAGPHVFYQARRAEFASSDSLAFRISPEPYLLTTQELTTVNHIGTATSDFLAAVDGLYRSDEQLATLLDTGKPASMKLKHDANYLFYRPDLIVTNDGFSVCEIETSPFGLGLSHLLVSTYAAAGFNMATEPQTLVDYVAEQTPSTGTIAYTPKTAQYQGQLGYLAETVLSGPNRLWDAQELGMDTPEIGGLYRAFYLQEYLGNAAVRNLLDNPDRQADIYPSITPHMEEKALMALLWDNRFEARLRSDLGDATYNFLRDVIPPTWIVGQEQHFAPGMPAGVQDSAGLAGLPKSKREFVLKSSGFSEHSSWSESVSLLHTKSVEATRALLQAALQQTDSLHIVQAFTPGTKIPLRYEDPTNPGAEPSTMLGRVRVTPYFAAVSGQLLTAKATARENTHFLHGSSDSINTAVGVSL